MSKHLMAAVRSNLKEEVVVEVGGLQVGTALWPDERPFDETAILPLVVAVAAVVVVTGIPSGQVWVPIPVPAFSSYRKVP